MASPSKRPASARAVARLLLALCAHRGASFQPRSPLRAPLPRAALRTRPPSRPPSRSRVPAQPAAGAGDGAGDGPAPPQPFLPAMAPDYAARGPVGRGDFVVSRGGPPVAAELADAQMLQIVRLECTDLEVNTLVWKCLGYRCDEGAGAWTPDAVFPKWKERFPAPPDFIGMTRVYSQEVDKPCLRANQALVRSIPAEHKQSLKKYMKPLGWKGYQVRRVRERNHACDRSLVAPRTPTTRRPPHTRSTKG